MVKNFSMQSLLGHIALFVFVEIIFVFLIFREFPEPSLYTKIGLAHGAYWIIVLGCSLWREQAKTVVLRFVALWTPMVFHLILHLWLGWETVEAHSNGHEHHEGEMVWLVIGTLVAGVLIYIGETMLHRVRHCSTHHQAAHKQCEAGACSDCEGDHQSS